jgi:transposase InsO family protein
MAQWGVTVNVKLAAVLARQAALREMGGSRAVPRLSVTALCAELGISRPTYYEAERRFLAEGLEGLLPRSRRPHSSPARTSAEVEDEIVRLRKHLADEGWDNGAVTIAFWLNERGFPVPAVSTINRILAKWGLVDPQPQKRPNSADRRFQYDERNGLWQADAFEWKLADGSKVAVFQLLDDCTRLDLNDLAAPAETSAAALACFLTAVALHGVPERLLTDNGLGFTGRILGWKSALEKAAAALGCQTIQTRPRHPQTNGKNERSHGTCKRWLRSQPLARTLAELQDQLDHYRLLYNTTRPHQSLDMKTPAAAAAAATIAVPASPVEQPPQQSVRRLMVKAHGDIAADDWQLCVGRKYRGQYVHVLRNGNQLTVLLGTTLLRELTIDPSRRFQRMTPAPGPTAKDEALSTMS